MEGRITVHRVLKDQEDHYLHDTVTGPSHFVAFCTESRVTSVPGLHRQQLQICSAKASRSILNDANFILEIQPQTKPMNCALMLVTNIGQRSRLRPSLFKIALQSGALRSSGSLRLRFLSKYFIPN